MSKLVRLHARDGNQVTSFIHHDDVVKKEERFFLEIKLDPFENIKAITSSWNPYI